MHQRRQTSMSQPAGGGSLSYRPFPAGYQVAPTEFPKASSAVPLVLRSPGITGYSMHASRGGYRKPVHVRGRLQARAYPQVPRKNDGHRPTIPRLPSDAAGRADRSFRRHQSLCGPPAVHRPAEIPHQGLAHTFNPSPRRGPIELTYGIQRSRKNGYAKLRYVATE